MWWCLFSDKLETIISQENLERHCSPPTQTGYFYAAHQHAAYKAESVGDDFFAMTKGTYNVELTRDMKAE